MFKDDDESIEAAKELEAEAEYWRKLKALGKDMGILHSFSLEGKELWSVIRHVVRASESHIEVSNTPEEALDAYYRGKEE